MSLDSQSSPDLTRRRLLKNSAFAAGFLGLGNYLRAASDAATFGQPAPSDRVIEPYGPLRKDRKGLLDLPKGFEYEVIARAGKPMTDGLLTPGKADGMAAFDGPDGRVVLVCNHELAFDQSPLGPFGKDKPYPADLDRALSFDAGEAGELPAIGGTTTIVYNPKTGKAEKQFLSLVGTDRNCAGGQMPWGSWITCEEPEDLTSPRGRKHGYCFEVKADPDSGLQKAVALTGLGRFRHEAVAYDPVDFTLYLTEDRNDGLLYRFVPKRKDDFSSGKLYALALEEKDSADLRNYDPKAEQVPEGRPMAVRWIEMEDIDSPKDDLRIRGHALGAARFARGEGIVFSGGAHYICCTDGGPGRQGQVYRLLPRHFDDAPPAIELFLQPEASDLLTNGDNICAVPNGDLIICEDLVGEHGETKFAHLRGITPEGQIYNLARNARDRSELAGSCFSPDGTTLFVNMQGLGLTLAINGPWRS